MPPKWGSSSGSLGFTRNFESLAQSFYKRLSRLHVPATHLSHGLPMKASLRFRLAKNQSHPEAGVSSVLLHTRSSAIACTTNARGPFNQPPPPSIRASFISQLLFISLLSITEVEMADPDLSNSASGSLPESDLHETAAELDDNPTNGLRVEGAPFSLEQVYDYEPGGHHPVQLGDIFDDGRYRVLHKLGSGGYANVWLSRDLAASTPKYVALKILMAEDSTEDCRELLFTEQLKATMVADDTGPICASLRHFRMDGPNGSHLCFVYPVLGPKVSSGLLNSSRDPEKALREICRETVAAVALLHGLGICHGGQISLKCFYHT